MQCISDKRKWCGILCSKIIIGYEKGTKKCVGLKNKLKNGKSRQCVVVVFRHLSTQQALGRFGNSLLRLGYPLDCESTVYFAIQYLNLMNLATETYPPCNISYNSKQN